ncbi:unnamed protein product, partial [Didymodactylos carnosus]
MWVSHCLAIVMFYKRLINDKQNFVLFRYDGVIVTIKTKILITGQHIMDHISSKICLVEQEVEVEGFLIIGGCVQFDPIFSYTLKSFKVLLYNKCSSSKIWFCATINVVEEEAVSP